MPPPSRIFAGICYLFVYRTFSELWQMFGEGSQIAASKEREINIAAITAFNVARNRLSSAFQDLSTHCQDEQQEAVVKQDVL